MAGRRALITGIAGQDGSYLAELLLGKGYEVHGLSRDARGHAGSAPLPDEVHFHQATIEDYDAVMAAFEAIRPDECYHLAGQTFIHGDPQNELATIRTNINGTHHVLAALRTYSPKCRIFIAGSSEMFGDVTESPQTEASAFHPRTVYGISKVTGYLLARHYRDAFGIYACCGILYNHESPRRPKYFLTRKVTSTAVRIRAGLEHELRLGNLDVLRDWGHARDYVRAMWLMLQHTSPDDYIVATGTAHSVREFVAETFDYLGLRWDDYVVSDPEFYRPAEPLPLVGLPRKAEQVLGWKPVADFHSLIREMIDEDERQLASELPAARGV